MYGLKQQESGGNYNAMGDKNSNGQYTAAGVGQWSNQVNGVPQPLAPGQIPINFQNDAKEFGLDPTDFSPANQNRVLYSVIEKDKATGLSPQQILSKWNSGDPNKYLTETTNRTGSVGTYNVANYVKEAMSYAQQYAQRSSNNSNSNGNGLPPPPVSPSSSATPTATTPTPAGGTANTQPESLGNKALDVAKGIGNFLFPIVGDIYGDVTGSNKKTVMQQVGDAALSALPLVPGLGEVGDTARAADLGAEATGGVLSKILGSTVAKGAGVGYGAGVASNLSQGQSLGQSFVPNLNNVSGAVLGGATPVVLKSLSGIIRGIAGINPAVANKLARMSAEGNPEDISLMKMYNQAAISHANNVETPSVENIAAENIDKAGAQITQQRQTAGALQGQIKQAVFNTPLKDTTAVKNSFANEIKQNYGIILGHDAEGGISLTQDATRRINNDPADVGIIKSIAQGLDNLGNGSVVGNATDEITNIDNVIGKLPRDQYGRTISPIDRLLVSTRNDLNNVVRESAPALAAANDKYSELKDMESYLNKMAGGDLQRGELLMQRAFTNKSADSIKLFNAIKDTTGIDLIKHATLAKNAIDNYGSQADKSQLAQMLKENATGSQGLANMILKGAGYAGRKIVANPSKISMNLLKGNAGMLPWLSPFITKTAIESSRGLQGISGGNQNP